MIKTNRTRGASTVRIKTHPISEVFFARRSFAQQDYPSRQRLHRGCARLRSMTESVPNDPSKPTPVLDRIIPLPASARSFDCRSVVWFLLSFAVVSYVLLPGLGEFPKESFVTKIPHLPSWPPTLGQLLLVVCAIPLTIMLAIVIHETAHVLMGMAVGFRLDSLRLGPLQVSRPFRISLIRDSSVAGGWASMFPIEAPGLPLRMAATAAAGSVANLLVGVSVLLVQLRRGTMSYLIVLTSLLTGLFELLPLQTGVGPTDGMQTLKLLRNREYRDRFLALARTRTEMERGVQPEALAAELLDTAIAIRDKSAETVFAYAVAFRAASRRDDVAKAAEYLETCLEYSTYTLPQFQHALMGDAASFQARRRKPIDLAEQWLALIPTRTEPPWLRASVETEILRANGDIDGALQKLEDIEAQILGIRHRTYRESTHRSFLKWKSGLRS
jgi:hypothetical protein